MKISEVHTITNPEGVWLFGGKAAGRKAPKKVLVPVRVDLQPRGVVKLVHAETGAEVLHSRVGTVVFAGPVDMPAEKAVKAPRKAAKAKVEPKAEEPAKLPGKAPKNFVELAQSGNTEAARRYWSRRVAQYEG